MKVEDDGGYWGCFVLCFAGVLCESNVECYIEVRGIDNTSIPLSRRLN